MRRSQRIAAITKWLVERPYQVVSLTEFAERFNAAKSTLSEDLAIIRETFAELEIGKIQTLPGATGGVRYIPELTIQEISRRIAAICEKLEGAQRILPGGFIYLNDLLASPMAIAEIGEVFATKFASSNPEYVVTVETSGIPIALMTARSLNIPLVVVNRINRPADGPVLTMNYLSGSSRQLQTMSLSRRALPKDSRVLIIDDFMKAGGTLRGLTDLMGEFECEVVGTGVLIETTEPKEKLISDYVSFILLRVNEEEQKIYVEQAKWIKDLTAVDANSNL
ncbi:MAG: pur operon repressor [Firmicutes bacterium]|nr:pur operon repressor [Bacillota bacterium]